MSKHQTLIFLSVDDFFLRNEWADDVPVISSEEIRPEEDFRIIDILKDRRVPATFFVPGILAELFPSTLKKLVESGFEVAAHGYRHENLALLKEFERRQRVQKSLDALEKAMGKKILGWRSPGLHVDDSLYKVLKDSHVRWCSNIELPTHFKQTPFMYKGKLELPIASIDLKLYQTGFPPSRVCNKWLSGLDRGHDIFTIVIHPWVQLKSDERLRSLRIFLEAANSKENVKFCSGSDVYGQYVSMGQSVYGAALSTISRIWKSFSRRAQAPLSRTQKVLSEHA